MLPCGCRSQTTPCASRQRKLGIDDFGEPISGVGPVPPELQDSPIPVTQGPPNGEPVQEAVSAAVHSDLHEEHDRENANEETPLLKKDTESKKSWLGWLWG